MDKFNVMISENRNTTITVEAKTVDDAKAQAMLKYLNKELNTEHTMVGVSVQIAPDKTDNIITKDNIPITATYC